MSSSVGEYLPAVHPPSTTHPVTSAEVGRLALRHPDVSSFAWSRVEALVLEMRIADAVAKSHEMALARLSPRDRAAAIERDAAEARTREATKGDGSAKRVDQAGQMAQRALGATPSTRPATTVGPDPALAPVTHTLTAREWVELTYPSIVAAIRSDAATAERTRMLASPKVAPLRSSSLIDWRLSAGATMEAAAAKQPKAPPPDPEAQRAADIVATYNAHGPGKRRRAG